MNNRRKNHKITGIYRTTDNIDDLKIRITFKTIISLIIIPSFHPIPTESSSEVKTDENEVVELQWQEKRLSTKEIQAYQFKENCKTDLEKKYHQLIKSRHLGSGEKSAGKIFTYTTEDNFDPEDFSALNKPDDVIDSKSDISSHSSVKQPSTPKKFGMSLLTTTRGFETYYVMVELNIDIVLIVIKWRKADGLLVIYPDFNNIHHSPYLLEVDADTKQMYNFSVENISAKIPKSPNQPFDRLKLHFQLTDTSTHRKQIILPSDRDCSKVNLFFQIVSGTGFEYDNIHVRFTIKIPPTAEPIDVKSLSGSTQSSLKNSKGVWHFSLCHEVYLQSFDHFQLEDFIDIDFRLLSIDQWKRERNEGFSTLRIPIKPGWEFRDTIDCYRLSTGTVLESLRRFFIGDKNYQEDFSIKRTLHQDGFNRYGLQTVSTGQIEVIAFLILQSKSGKIIYETVE